MRDAPNLQSGDTVVVCKKSPIEGVRAKEQKCFRKCVDVTMHDIPVATKLTKNESPPKLFKLGMIANTQALAASNPKQSVWA
jgi:hypothetical protein